MKNSFLISVLLLLSVTGFSSHLSSDKNTHKLSILKEFSFISNGSENLIQYYQLNNEVVISIKTELTWDQTSYYIIDENKSIVGGGTLSSLSNTIILTKFPKGNYTIKLKAKSIIASQSIRIL